MNDPTLEEILELGKWYERTFGEGFRFPRVRDKILTKGGITFHSWITAHFDECNALCKKIERRAKEVFGPDGWRKVLFEAVCLWVLRVRYSSDVRKIRLRRH